MKYEFQVKSLLQYTAILDKISCKNLKNPSHLKVSYFELLCRFIFSSIIIFFFFDWGRCDTRSAFSSVLFQLISFVYNITSDTLYVFCIIYTYLYNLQFMFDLYGNEVNGQ